MAIANNQEFKVVSVATLTQYNDIASKDPATAYWVVDKKKIYLDGVPYGFNFSDDVTANLINGLWQVGDTDTVDLTLVVSSGKMSLKADVKLADYINKTWKTSSVEGTDLDVADPSITSDATFRSYLSVNYPASNYPLNFIARGCEGTLPVTTYYYAVVEGSAGDSLLKKTASGIELLKEDVEGIANAQIQTKVLDKKGVADGFAELDSGGKVLSSQLPSYVDDVLTYANLAAFPTTGESGKIYVAKDTEKTYRWTGSAYVNIATGNLVLGETSSTAYRGDRGKIAYDHSQLTSGNPHSVSKTDIGLSNVQNYGIASDAEAEAGGIDIKYMTPIKTAKAIDALAQKVVWKVIS